MSRQKFTTNNKIYTLYETAKSTVCVPSKIICAEGIKQVGAVTSGQRGTTVTTTAAVYAIGSHYCPVLILSVVHFKNHMLSGAPTASVGVANTTVWSNERLCFECLKNFIACEKACKEDQVVLILDSQQSHLSISALKW